MVKHVCNNTYISIFAAAAIIDVSVTFIDKTDPFDPLKREDCYYYCYYYFDHYFCYYC